MQVKVEAGEGDTLDVRSPAVGWWSDLPIPGTLLGPGTSPGTIVQGRRSIRLELPPGVWGRVRDLSTGDRRVAVGWGDLLFRLSPIDVGAAAPEATAARATLPDGCFAVTSPTDGIFYRGDAPDAPPFAAVGQRLEHGQPVGLVEVMKTFNQVAYGGAVPERGLVVEVRAANGEEVRAGQILLVVRPG